MTQIENPEALWRRAQADVATMPDQIWARLTRLHVLNGQHNRRRTGDGQEFWQYRPLTEGDSLSRVDWRKSARGDSLLLRDREQQGRQRFRLWCDQSPSMHFRGSRAQRSKAEHAYLLAAMLSQLAARAGEEIRLVQETATRDFPQQLATPQPLAPALLRADTCLFVISDFLEVDLTRLNAVSLVICLHVLDPDETDFPFEGHIRFEGLEGETPLIAASAGTLRAAYLAAQHDLQQRIAAASRCNFSCPTNVAPAGQIEALADLALA